LKKWIVKHANFYRKRVRLEMNCGNTSMKVIWHYRGHIAAMRALWDDLKIFQDANFVGLFKSPELVE